MNGENNRWFNWASLLIATVAMAAAIAGVMMQSRSNAPQIRFRTLNAVELTSVQEVPGLIAEFKYRDNAVKQLWKTNVRFENSGNCALIGTGARKSLIGDSLKFVFPADSKVLDHQIVSNDFGGKFQMTDAHTLIVMFDQWRKMEKADLSLFIETTSPSKQAPIPLTTRDLIDGEILVDDIPAPSKPTTLPLLDYLPGPLPLVVRVVASVVCVLIGCMFFFVGLSGAWNFLKLRGWKLQNWHGFKRFIAAADNAEMTDQQKSRFLSFPYQMPEAAWKKFEGERLNLNTTDVVFDTWKQAFFFCSFFVPLGLAIVAFVASSWWRL
jgi:hypothetical protein